MNPTQCCYYTHLGPPDAGAVIEEGASLANLVYVVDVPDIETVVVVHARQLVVAFVQTHGDRVREGGVALLRRCHLTVNQTHVDINQPKYE